MKRIVIVGKGLVGAAAARHLAGRVDELVLVGPDEPAAYADHGGVFASHYDAARITRRLDRDPVWSALAQASIARYAQLETDAGVRFHHPCGFLAAGTPESGLIPAMRAVANAQGIAAEAATRLPSLALPEASDTLFEQDPAGWIDPRAMIRAQVLAAAAAGCRVLRRPAWALRPAAGGRTRAILDDGAEIAADRVVLCAGAFTSVTGLEGEALALRADGRTVALACVDALNREAREALDALPAIIDVRDGAVDPPDVYVLPPVRYPHNRGLSPVVPGGRRAARGRRQPASVPGLEYVKIGSGAWAHPLESLEAVQQWFRGPPAMADVERLQARLSELLPPLAHAEIATANCVVAETASGYPIVDWTTPGRIAVAAGGNGQGAKGADEIGRLAARLVLDEAPDAGFDTGVLRL